MTRESLLSVFTVFAILASLGTRPAEGKSAKPQPIPLLDDNNPDPETTAITELSTEIDNSVPEQAFISYRRSNSRNFAMLLKVLMERENVPVFLDVEYEEGDPWNPQIGKRIDESPNFILVLANGTLDRAKGDVNFTDFVHSEIRQAVVNDKRIILVFDDYDFPSATDFSPEIQTALQNQGLTWQHALVDQSLERLLSYMDEPKTLVSKYKSTLPSRQG